MRRLAATSLALMACGQPSPSPGRAGMVLLPALGLSLHLPPGSAVFQSPAGPWVLDLRPGARQPMRVSLTPSPPGGLDPPEHDPSCPWQGPVARVLGPGSRVTYYTSVGCGGSGGVEAALVGRWSIRDRDLALECLVQAEPVFSEGPDPTFCLAVLGDARTVPVTQDPPVVAPGITSGDPLRHLERDLTPAL